MPFKKIMKRDFPEQSKMWDKIGLGAEFRESFPNKESHWNSNISFVQIYERLKS